ncbi:TetR family transcriptional regulator [Rhodococcus opacus]|uniref:TetR family transcriptional regulator n=1 Tax=Rhodococcus opacus TaxID=37919 RepID=A0A2S8JA37_RHOOP|nr:TetR family transcriptional regulator [Rhodococcus opacus]
MAEQITDAPNCLDRRESRTRAALVRAAESFMAAEKLTASMLEVAQVADVGMGTFYNHFHAEEELFHVAVEDALDRHDASSAGC